MLDRAQSVSGERIGEAGTFLWTEAGSGHPLEPVLDRNNDPVALGHSGMFPCFLGGRVSRLERSSRSERMISMRVSWGAMTAST